MAKTYPARPVYCDKRNTPLKIFSPDQPTKISHLSFVSLFHNRDNGEWTNLSHQERTQNLSNLSHIGMMARFDNILGRDTVRTLVRLSAHAPYVFCHPTIVERIASMLNYFLLNLVGPNKKNFKVRNHNKM